MKKLLSSEKLVPLLLIVISSLLSILSFIGHEQIKSIKNIGTQFKNFQIETIKSNFKLDKTIQLEKQWAHEIYQKEIQPNTKRSLKNENDIKSIKSDVTNIKHILK